LVNKKHGEMKMMKWRQYHYIWRGGELEVCWREDVISCNVINVKNDTQKIQLSLDLDYVFVHVCRRWGVSSIVYFWNIFPKEIRNCLANTGENVIGNVCKISVNISAVMLSKFYKTIYSNFCTNWLTTN